MSAPKQRAQAQDARELRGSLWENVAEGVAR